MVTNWKLTKVRTPSAPCRLTGQEWRHIPPMRTVVSRRLTSGLDVSRIVLYEEPQRSARFCEKRADSYWVSPWSVHDQEPESFLRSNWSATRNSCSIILEPLAISGAPGTI